MTNQIYVCTGKTAENPFYFEKTYTNIYSIEELCYVIYENAFLIDRDICSRALVDWIEKECKLHDLSRHLYALLNQNALPSAFVGMILEYVGFYSPDEISKVESILRMNVSMNVFEKWKAKADFLFENRHFLLALKEYEHLCENLDEDEMDLRSKIYNNMGVTYMNLYLFDSAIECFKRAYEINNDETAYRHYLAAKRIEMSDDDYIKMVADEEDAYRVSVSIESGFADAKEEYSSTMEANHLQEVFALRQKNENSLYYEEITRMTENLKADYRDIALEGDVI